MAVTCITPTRKRQASASVSPSGSALHHSCLHHWKSFDTALSAQRPPGFSGASKGDKDDTLWGLAERMPTRVNSDHLTVLGAAGMFLAGLSYWYSRSNRPGLLPVILFLAVNWFGDSLDGTLVRGIGPV